jgi:cell wall-associated NlpC family hydrolase
MSDGDVSADSDQPSALSRQRIIEISRTWLGTPYHDCAGLKGIGTDCAHFPVAVYHECGLLPKLELPRYSPQFMMNSSQEIYLGLTLDNAREVREPTGPGDFVLWKFGRCFSHGAIVVDWPTIIHAEAGKGVVVTDARRHPLLSRDRSGPRPKRFFTLFPAVS